MYRELVKDVLVVFVSAVFQIPCAFNSQRGRLSGWNASSC